VKEKLKNIKNEHIKKCFFCEKKMNMNNKNEYKTIMHNQIHRYVCSKECMIDFYK
jgi:hypothetical protein